VVSAHVRVPREGPATFPAAAAASSDGPFGSGDPSLAAAPSNLKPAFSLVF